MRKVARGFKTKKKAMGKVDISMVEFLAKHAKQYYDLIPTLKTASFITPGSLQRRPYFLHLQYHAAEKWRENSGKNEAECTGKEEIGQVEFLPLDKACKGYILSQSILKRQTV